MRPIISVATSDKCVALGDWRSGDCAIGLARIDNMDVIVLARRCCAKTQYSFASQRGYVGTPILAPATATFDLLGA